MSRMIQLRNVSDEVHKAAKARATREGLSLSDFVKRELQRSLEQPTMAEWLEGVGKKKRIPISGGAAALIRQMRDSR